MRKMSIYDEERGIAYGMYGMSRLRESSAEGGDAVSALY
jgi:hypothetical protein